MKVRGPQTGGVLFKIENCETPDFLEISQPLTIVNQWQKLTFDFENAQTNFNGIITLFFDFGLGDTNTYYLDDIIFIGEGQNSISNSFIHHFKLYPNPASKVVILNFGDEMS